MPRLAADAVLDLWERESGEPGGDRSAAAHELRAAADRVGHWFEAFGAALAGTGGLPEPMPRDPTGQRRLVDTIRRDLIGHDGLRTPTAVRMIWTGDHIDAVRRLQAVVTGPARALVRQSARGR